MQGSGKGTLGKAVAERYGMQIFETGNELRKLSHEESELGQKVKSIVEAGNLVPNEVVMEIVENFMDSIDPNSPILFDGIPRKVTQAKNLNEVLDKHNREYKAVLLELSEESALKRLTTRRICKTCKAVYPATYTEENCKCGDTLTTRSDDNPEAIKTRLQAFQEETVPAIEMYKDKLITIDGEPSIEDVQTNTFEILDKIMLD